jgi:hypothetical protein
MKTTTAVKSAAESAVTDEREPLKLQKRIGSTTFIVNVRFSNTSNETPEDKILRLIEREVDRGA